MLFPTFTGAAASISIVPSCDKSPALLPSGTHLAGGRTPLATVDSLSAVSGGAFAAPAGDKLGMLLLMRSERGLKSGDNCSPRSDMDRGGITGGGRSPRAFPRRGRGRGAEGGVATSSSESSEPLVVSSVTVMVKPVVCFQLSFLPSTNCI